MKRRNRKAERGAAGTRPLRDGLHPAHSKEFEFQGCVEVPMELSEDQFLDLFLAFIEAYSAGNVFLVYRKIAHGIAALYLFMDNFGVAVHHISARGYHLVHDALPHKVHGAAQDAFAVVTERGADVL